MKRSKKVEQELAETAVENPQPTKSTKKGSFNGKKANGKPTVADLQTAVEESTGKIKKAKKAAKKTIGDVFGHSVASVARALGAAKWMPADAIAAIHSIVPKASKLGIRTYVQAGKQGLRGDPAKLTKAEFKKLEQAAAEAAAFAARPGSTGKAAA